MASTAHCRGVLDRSGTVNQALPVRAVLLIEPSPLLCKEVGRDMKRKECHAPISVAIRARCDDIRSRRRQVDAATANRHTIVVSASATCSTICQHLVTASLEIRDAAVDATVALAAERVVRESNERRKTKLQTANDHWLSRVAELAFARHPWIPECTRWRPSL